MFVYRHQVVGFPSGLRKPPLQKLIERLQVLQPPVLTGTHFAQVLASSTNLVSRSFSCRASQARIASILFSTSWARRRFSFGGMGGHLVSKFVKQTKIDSRLANQPCLDQVVLIETQPKEWTGSTGILGEADAAVWQEQC